MNFSNFYDSLDEKQRKYFNKYIERIEAERKLHENIAHGVVLTFVFFSMLVMFGPTLVAINNSLNK